MKLTDSTIRTFKPVKYFKENSDRINSLSYSSNGETLISSSDDDQMVTYDCSSGTVVSLCMSPIDDTFLSGSMDSTIRLWDLRSPNCHVCLASQPAKELLCGIAVHQEGKGVMHVSGRPTAAFDPEGLIFAAGINSESVKLYDLRSFDKGPFATFKLGMETSGCIWTGLQFSSDGKALLITTNGTHIRLVDAFKGSHLHTLAVIPNTDRQTLHASFTPDSQFVLIGSPDGVVHIWSVETGVRVASLPGYEAATQLPNAAIHSLAFNPRFAMLATGSNQTSFWLPALEE
ncbi:unnamed protein product [Schistosoma margrebowiei]|uniref:Uncharacterized protein n=1 Tax=Schistosoma margrebowiei TaxID=48269 RepID=A0A183MR05_9TREM|nr:unnamed protein product [Schistosoma margrebowiei]